MANDIRPDRSERPTESTRRRLPPAGLGKGKAERQGILGGKRGPVDERPDKSGALIRHDKEFIVTPDRLGFETDRELVRQVLAVIHKLSASEKQSLEKVVKQESVLIKCEVKEVENTPQIEAQVRQALQTPLLPSNALTARVKSLHPRRRLLKNRPSSILGDISALALPPKLPALREQLPNIIATVLRNQSASAGVDVQGTFERIEFVLQAAREPIRQALEGLLTKLAGGFGDASAEEKRRFVASLRDVLMRFDLRVELANGTGPRAAILRCVVVKKAQKKHSYFVLERRVGTDVRDHGCGASLPALRVVDSQTTDARKSLPRNNLE